MPDTAENQTCYSQPNTQAEGVGFPLARVVGVICLATGALIDAAIGPHAGKGGSEMGLLLRLEVRDYVEMKIRTLLTRRKRRQKRSIGWRRWSNEYLYDVLGLYWDWKIQPLPGLGKLS